MNTSILSKCALFAHVNPKDYEAILHDLHAQVKTYEKGEVLLMLGEPFLYAGIVMDGTIEGSFITENDNKINVNEFRTGKSFGEALAIVHHPLSPIQLRALTQSTVLFLDLHTLLINNQKWPQLQTNVIRILSGQNIFSNLKLRIASQKSIRDKVYMYLHSLMVDSDGFVRIPFTQTAFAEFLGVNRSALSRELGHMQDEGLLLLEGHRAKLL